MDEILKFLNDTPSTFYIATTVDGDIPKVRPFGFAMIFDGKLCFCTSNRKDVYKQLKANPNLEICTDQKNGEWLRLKGKAVFNTSKQSRQAALDVMPRLSNMYSVDDSIFEIFYIDNAEAALYNMKGSSRTIKL